MKIGEVDGNVTERGAVVTEGLLGDAEAGLAEIVEAGLERPRVVAFLPKQRRRDQHSLARAAVQVKDLLCGELVCEALPERVALGFLTEPAQRDEDRAFKVALVPLALLPDV